MVTDLELLLGDKLTGRRIFLITGQRSLDKNGSREKIKHFLRKKGSLIGDERVSANPSQPSLPEHVKKSDPEVILAIGGGSVIDHAKKLAKDHLTQADIFVVYTRFGSGTIVTPFSIFDNEEFKIGEYVPESIPSHVYCDIGLMNRLSRKERSVAISDILAHAVESILSTLGDEPSNQKAEEALCLLGDDPLSLSTHTLLSADISAALAEKESLVLLPHAIGHYLTYRYGIPHGIASILPLGAYLSYLDGNHKKRVPTGRILKIRNTLLKTYEKEGGLVDVRLKGSEYKASYELIKKYMPFAIDNSPKKVDETVYYSLLNSM